MSNKFGVGCNPPPSGSDAPPGPSGPADIPTAPTKENRGHHFEGAKKDGKHRLSGNPNAHRIGRKK